MSTLGSNIISSTGNITTTANISGGYVLGNGSQLTGLVGSSYGNADVAANLAAFGSNPVSTTGNITAGNISATGSVTGLITPRIVTIADAASITMNADTTDMAIQTNTQAVGTLTINAPTGTLYQGQKIMLRLQSTNVQTFSWNAVFVGSTDLSLPTTSSGTSKYDYVGFIYNSTATKWQIIAKNFGF